VVTHFQPAHAAADLDDLTGDLVADDAGKLHLPPPGLGVLDGQAGAAGDDTGHRFAGTGNRIGTLLQLERQVRARQHHRLHWISSQTCRTQRCLSLKDLFGARIGYN
jgi:hypothetical protein